MPLSAFGASPQQPLHRFQINSQNNSGLIGGGSNNFVNSGTIVNSDIVIGIDDLEDELDRYLGHQVSKDALRNSFYSPPECHPNTRTAVRNEIGEWMDESGSEKSPLLWLNGPAAVGKSVIAKTISGFPNQIVATFFFSTSSDRSATTLFPTLAWQLARSIPDTRRHIIDALKQSGSLPTSQLEEQFDLLIIQPLKKSTVTLRSRPVMMIDGADECTDENMLVRFLLALVHASEGGDMPVRFIICSRPEARIRAILGRARNATNNQQPKLPGLAYVLLRLLFALIVAILFLPIAPIAIAASIASILSTALFRFILIALIRLIPSSAASIAHCLRISNDYLHSLMRLYRNLLPQSRRFYIRPGVDTNAPSSATSSELVDELDKICSYPVISTIQIGFSEECKKDIARYLTDRFNAIHHPGVSWFQPSDISNLVEASCGQFLYASTIVRLLDESYFDPREVLTMTRRSSLPTPDLNKLYKVILKRAQDTVQNKVKEGGPNYKTEWGFVMDSLAILVFFASSDDVFTVRKSLPVIETLLGLENGKLTLQLRNMHSVLRIVPEESIQVYHRSFLEFLQSQRRAEEYYIGFSSGLRRSLILMIQAGLRHNKMILYALAM